MYTTLTSLDLQSVYGGNSSSNTNSFMDHTNQTTVLPHQVFLPCDNPRNIISPHVANTIGVVVFAAMFPVLMIYGVITNVINMAVFARQGLWDRINLCLFSLAVSDTGFLVFLVCGKSYAIVSLVDQEAGDFWKEYHFGTVLASCLGFLVISNVITAVIAVERCLCVISPLKAARIFKTKYTGILIVTMAVYVLIVVNWDFSTRFQTVHVTDPLTNTSTYISRFSPFYLRHQTLIDILDNFMILMTLPVLSVIIVIVCTSVIIFRLKVTSAWRREAVSNMTSVEKQEVKVTKMLVTVCVVYVISMIPTLARQTALFLQVPGFVRSGYLCNAFKVSAVVSHLFEVVNACSNFIIYLQQSSRYQSTLQKLCSRVSQK